MPSLIIAIATLVGCGTKVQHVKFPTDKSRSRTVISLSPGTSEIISSDTFQAQLKGRTAADNYPPSVLKVPVVASLKPDYELIKNISPDIIVYDASLYNGQDVEKLKALNIKLFAVDGDTIEDFKKSLYELGSKVGNETNIADYVDRIDFAAAQAEGDKPSPTPNVAVIMPEAGGSDMIAGSKSLLADIVKICGGKFVGPAADRFVPLSPEFLVSANPDLILIPSSKEHASSDVQLLLNDPRFKSVKAVQARKIRVLDQDIMLRRGSRVDLLIKAVHMAFTAKGGN